VTLESLCLGSMVTIPAGLLHGHLLQKYVAVAGGIQGVYFNSPSVATLVLCLSTVLSSFFLAFLRCPLSVAASTLPNLAALSSLSQNLCLPSSPWDSAITNRLGTNPIIFRGTRISLLLELHTLCIRPLSFNLLLYSPVPCPQQPTHNTHTYNLKYSFFF
jgi:hypothetical protein